MLFSYLDIDETVIAFSEILSVFALKGVEIPARGLQMHTGVLNSALETYLLNHAHLCSYISLFLKFCILIIR